MLLTEHIVIILQTEVIFFGAYDFVTTYLIGVHHKRNTFKTIIMK